jgi:RimJ/RimL family protein N-acetyltransferase
MSLVDTRQKQEYFDYLNKALDATYDHTNSAVIASLDTEGKILGVVLFSQFTRNNCEITCASNSKYFLNRNFMDVFFHYAFITAKVRRVNALVATDNEASKNLCRRVGFIEEGVLKHWFGDKDAAIFRMTIDECRWLKKSNKNRIKRGKNG